MAEVSKTPANVAINAMQAIPFSSMIGGPLNACIEAQAMAARTSWEFIKEVGLNTDEKGQKSAVMVAFSFNRGGRMVQLNVPLLTIVPIPYIAINTIDINFKASISASSSTASETTEHTEAGGELGAKAELNLGLFSMEANLKANYSSKKDSKATAESKYSVESTIDVAVKAGQEGMPAGMAKVLELLGSALDVVDAKRTRRAFLTTPCSRSRRGIPMLSSAMPTRRRIRSFSTSTQRSSRPAMSSRLLLAKTPSR